MFGICGICVVVVFFFFQAEDGIRDLVRSRGLGDVYKRQVLNKETSRNTLNSFGMLLKAITKTRSINLLSLLTTCYL